MSSVPVIELDDTQKYYFDLSNVKLSGNVKDADDGSKVFLHYILDSNNEKVSQECNLSNHKLDFEIDLTNENLFEGSHHIKIWAIDNQGNLSNFAEKDFFIASISKPILYMNEEWSNEAVKFFITVTEENSSKVSKYQYKIDSGNWIDIEKDQEQLALDTTGIRTISARAISKDGTIASDKVSKIARVDKQNPVLKYSINNKKITISATDEHSGLSTIEYLLSYSDTVSETDTFTKYTAPLEKISADNQKVYLHMRAFDRVGNKDEAQKEFEVPVVTTIVCDDSFTYTQPKFKLIDSKNQDPNIYEFCVRFNGGEWQKVSAETVYSIQNSQNGNNTIETKTVDFFGRESTINKKNYNFGSNSPSNTIDNNTISNTIDNNIGNNVVNNTVYNTVNNTIYNTVNNTINNRVDNSTNNSVRNLTSEGNNVDPNVKLNTISPKNTTNDTTLAQKIIPKTGAEKTIGILLITTLISLFLYGKYVKFS